jgi:hypothetical protein
MNTGNFVIYKIDPNEMGKICRKDSAGNRAASIKYSFYKII